MKAYPLIIATSVCIILWQSAQAQNVLSAQQLTSIYNNRHSFGRVGYSPQIRMCRSGGYDIVYLSLDTRRKLNQAINPSPRFPAAASRCSNNNRSLIESEVGKYLGCTLTLHELEQSDIAKILEDSACKEYAQYVLSIARQNCCVFREACAVTTRIDRASPAILGVVTRASDCTYLQTGERAIGSFLASYLKTTFVPGDTLGTSLYELVLRDIAEQTERNKRHDVCRALVTAGANTIKRDYQYFAIDSLELRRFNELKSPLTKVEEGALECTAAARMGVDKIVDSLGCDATIDKILKIDSTLHGSRTVNRLAWLAYAKIAVSIRQLKCNEQSSAVLVTARNTRKVDVNYMLLVTTKLPSQSSLHVLKNAQYIYDPSDLRNMAAPIGSAFSNYFEHLRNVANGHCQRRSKKSK